MGGLKGFIYQQIGNYNPAGIQINLGWYALAEAIITGRPSGVVLTKWCGIKDKPKNPLELCAGDFKGAKTKLIVEALNQHGFTLSNKELAQIAKCSTEMVSRVLRKLGVSKRNRWDGYISANPRYSKEKRGTKNAETL